MPRQQLKAGRSAQWIVLLFFMVAAKGVQAQCKIDNLAFAVGEKLEYSIYYNWGPIWVYAGDVDFKADTTTRHGKEAFHFVSTGQSKPSYDWFFKVRDRFESWAERGSLRPIEFYRNTSEGNYQVSNWYLFDADSKTVTLATSTSKRPYKKETKPSHACLFDVLTASYYTRCLNFEKMQEGSKIPVHTLLDNTLCDLYIRYLGRETIKHRNSESVACLKFKAKVAEGSVFKGGEDITVWVSDDAAHIPIKIEAKILVGSVKAYLNRN
jgi:hypothetical protein